MHKCIILVGGALLSLTTDFVSAAPPCLIQAMHNVSQDFAACPAADNFSLSIPPSFPYDRHIRTIMDLQHSSPLNHLQTLFLKLY